MTTPKATSPTRLDRWSGACWVAAWLLLLIGVFHPDVFETTFADAALDTPLWVPMHAAAPEVFACDGPVIASWAIRVTTGLALLWLIGLCLLGLALWRSHLIPRSRGPHPRHLRGGVHRVRRPVRVPAWATVDAGVRDRLHLGRSRPVNRRHHQLDPSWLTDLLLPAGLIKGPEARMFGRTHVLADLFRVVVRQDA